MDYQKLYTESLENFENYLRNIVDSEELTSEEKINLIKKEL